MKFEEITRDEWVPFCNAFSRRHEGWTATLTVEGGGESRPIAESLPLVGVTAEMSRPDEQQLILTLGQGQEEVSEGVLTHVVRGPRRIEVGLDDAKKPAALRIESNEGPVFLLTFSEGGGA